MNLERDKLDRYYTPPELAERCLRSRGIPEILAAHLSADPGLFGSRSRLLLEPSAGGGAFVRAASIVEAGGRPIRRYARGVVAVDVDPEAAAIRGGLEHDADLRVLSDFERFPPGLLEVGAVIGNPPFKVAEQHVRHALEVVGPRGVVLFLLPFAFRASRRRAPLFREHPPAIVRVIPDRPSFRADGASDLRDVAIFIWSRMIDPEPGIGEVEGWEG